MDFEEAVLLYKDKFDETPTVFGLTQQQEQRAVDVLLDAIDKEQSMTDEEFWHAIGMESPPEDADI